MKAMLERFLVSHKNGNFGSIFVSTMIQFIVPQYGSRDSLRETQKVLP